MNPSTHTNSSIVGSITSMGAYLASISNINLYMQFFLGLLSGCASVFTIINLYRQNKKNETS